MKIFNWVQKRFPHNVLKDGLARNVKKTDSIAIDTNSKALLEQVALFDVLDGWRYGVLSIVTFGFDPLKSIAEQKDASETNEDEKEADQCYNNNDDKQVNPLLLGHNFEDIEDVTAKRRTTLADLFYDEDSDMKKKPSTPVVDSELNASKKASFCTKKGPSFANKFIPQVRKDSRPVKKLNQMMNRMLKRKTKIHPDLERKGYKIEVSTDSTFIYMKPKPV